MCCGPSQWRDSRPDTIERWCDSVCVCVKGKGQGCGTRSINDGKTERKTVRRACLDRIFVACCRIIMQLIRGFILKTHLQCIKRTKPLALHLAATCQPNSSLTSPGIRSCLDLFPARPAMASTARHYSARAKKEHSPTHTTDKVNAMAAVSMITFLF